MITTIVTCLLLLCVPVVLTILYVACSPSKGARASGFWHTYGDNIKGLGYVIIALVLINCLCYLGGWWWWQAGWNRPLLFTATQTAIIFACCVLMFTKNGFAQIFAIIALVTAIYSWANVAWTEKGKADLRAGHWTTFEVPVGKTFRIQTEWGVPFDYMLNNEPTVYHSGPNGEYVLVPGRLVSFDIKPSRDMRAHVVYSDYQYPR